MSKPPHIQVVNPTWVELTWPAEISNSTLLEMLAIKDALREALSKSLRDLRMGYHRITLQLTPGTDISPLLLELETLLSERLSANHLPRRRWHIPVCYHPSLSKDLEHFSLKKALTIDEIVTLHTSADYRLYFYGFLPGFMYLGGLNQQLHLARKPVPDRKIEKGSVAIGGQQTGIYPVDSPGGWHVIGKTPIILFDSVSETLPPLASGDRIRFYPISLTEFKKWQTDPKTGFFYDEI